jgi:hypothetical protein
MQFPATSAQQAPANAPVVVQIPGVATPKQIYDALRSARRELGNQVEDVEGLRREIASQLRQPGLSDADKTGLQQRLAAADQRLASLDIAKTEADAAVAKQAAVPGSIQADPPRPQDVVPEEVFVLTGIFFFVVLFPLTIAYARRIWRRGAPSALPQEIYDRFTRVEQTLDTIAIEVERVGEGQRFLTRMQAEQSERALGPGPAERVEAAGREKVRDTRR